ncbi:hypothetical protein EYZ11_005411 [Aspergillus tanneri]|uniref:Uncharacterized protein n=1 Tax=Aspergillus tanneri TaxID=1220188 RepID=A0A4S3JKF4_9EURO|nr:hypothetical protein EYZ11_005411 [Aspergillus tanneri]
MARKREGSRTTDVIGGHFSLQ